MSGAAISSERYAAVVAFPASRWFRDNAVGMTRPTIDRILSGGHYELSNCRFLEHRDNASRRFNPDTPMRNEMRRQARYRAWMLHNDKVVPRPFPSALAAAPSAD